MFSGEVFEGLKRASPEEIGDQLELSKSFICNAEVSISSNEMKEFLEILVNMRSCEHRPYDVEQILETFLCTLEYRETLVHEMAASIIDHVLEALSNSRLTVRLIRYGFKILKKLTARHAREILVHSGFKIVMGMLVKNRKSTKVRLNLKVIVSLIKCISEIVRPDDFQLIECELAVLLGLDNTLQNDPLCLKLKTSLHNLKTRPENEFFHLTEIKYLLEDKELHDDILLCSGLVPALLYYLIGVEDITNDAHPSELTVVADDACRKRRSSRIKLFVHIFLGCMRDTLSPPKANETKPFKALINRLHSALALMERRNKNNSMNSVSIQEWLDDCRRSTGTSKVDNTKTVVNKIDEYLIPTQRFTTDDPGVLSLLNALYGINQHYCDLFQPGPFDPPLSTEDFANHELFRKFRFGWEKNPDDTYSIWCSRIIFQCPFVMPFRLRWNIIKELGVYYNCEEQRFGHYLQEKLDSAELYNELKKKAKITVSRQGILEESKHHFRSLLVRSKTVEVKFKDEIGEGLGPTKEYFTSISHELQKPELNLWRDASPSYGLFPKPIKNSSLNIGMEFSNFELIGNIMAKSLLNRTLMDMDFNQCFYKWLLGEERFIGLNEFYTVDPQLAITMAKLQSIADQRNELLNKARVENWTSVQIEKSLESLKMEGANVEDLHLNFTLPGCPEIPLKEGGTDIDVTLENLAEYVQLFVQTSLTNGVSEQMKAIRNGFNSIFPLEFLRLFSAKELEQLFCGPNLNHSIHMKEWIQSCEVMGFPRKARIRKRLAKIVCKYDLEKQKSFLNFVTGSPRIQQQGPRCTVQPLIIYIDGSRKSFTDDRLPTAMTCSQTLLLPNYSTVDVMRTKLDLALAEGQNSFQYL